MRVALLDGDILAYRAAAKHQKTMSWDDDTDISVRYDAKAAAEDALTLADTWAALAGCRQSIVLFSGPNNFRKAVLPTYKANRKDVAKPMAYAYTVDAVKNRFDHRVVEGLEADDLMGILATSPKYDGSVVVTIDKDLLTVPGRHLNPGRGVPKIITVTEDEANHGWMRQALMGDPTDGYGGCPKIGPTRADALLGRPGRSVEALWEIVVGAYRKAGQDDSTAVAMARVARILRREDYDKTTKEISLWTPTQTTPERFSLGTKSFVSPPTERVS